MSTMSDEEAAAAAAGMFERLRQAREGRPLGAVDDGARAELVAVDAIAARLATRQGQVGRRMVDRQQLDALAAKCGLPLAEVLALEGVTPSPPLSPIEPLWGNEEARRIAGWRVPRKVALLLSSGKLRDKKPLVDVRSWLATEAPEIIVLGGENGQGKTVAGCWMLLQRGGGLYCKAEELMQPGLGPQLVERASGAGGLFIDEMGYETLHAVGLTRMLSLIGQFEDTCRPVVCATNIAARGDRDSKGQLLTEGWAERYGGRLVDRVRGDGNFIVYKGPSLRGPA